MAVEWRLTSQHLVEQNTKGPPVHRTVVLLTQQDLRNNNWLLYSYLASKEAKPIAYFCKKVKGQQLTFYLRGDVVRSPAEGGCLRLVLHVLLAHTEVCDLYVTIRVQ